MTYTFTNNYNEELAQYIDELFSQDKAEKLARASRLQASDSLVESYVKHTGLRPPGAQLGRLATLILRDELADTNLHKVSQEESPILSDVQLARRKFGRRGSDWTNMRGELVYDENTEEDSENHHSSVAAHLGSDGKDYRKPIRRTRSISELIDLDRRQL